MCNFYLLHAVRYLLAVGNPYGKYMWNQALDKAADEAEKTLDGLIDSTTLLNLKIHE